VTAAREQSRELRAERERLVETAAARLRDRS